MGFKPPAITVLPGGRKVRTDLRPYADDPAPEPESPPRGLKVSRKLAKKPKAGDE